jgi:hypothetical protein
LLNVDNATGLTLLFHLNVFEVTVTKQKVSAPLYEEIKKILSAHTLK